jgi:hypothetical protein
MLRIILYIPPMSHLSSKLKNSEDVLDLDYTYLIKLRIQNYKTSLLFKATLSWVS